MGDRFGIAYRPQLAASVFAHTDEIDVIEVIADDWFGASRSTLGALAELSRVLPTQLHAVSLGLASASPVERSRVYALARVVDAVGQGVWSEHLAFVRAGGIELGHLCAPPRTLGTLEGLARNVEVCVKSIGVAPRLENVATLIDPPCSDFDEAEFVTRAVQMTGAPLLLDLHNLHANATNFGFDAAAWLARVPLEHVRGVHLAGGRWIGGDAAPRLLDDHRHAVPDQVYALLEELAAFAPNPLDVIVERDGTPPPWRSYRAELECARAAVARGRRRFAAVAAEVRLQP